MHRNWHICVFYCTSSDRSTWKQTTLADCDFIVKFISHWKLPVLCKPAGQYVRWFVTLFFFFFNSRKKTSTFEALGLIESSSLTSPSLGEPKCHRSLLRKKIYYIYYIDSLTPTCRTEWHRWMTAREQGPSHFFWGNRKMKERFDKIIQDWLPLFSAKLCFLFTSRLRFAQSFQWINFLNPLYFFASPWIAKKPPPAKVCSAELHKQDLECTLRWLTPS